MIKRSLLLLFFLITSSTWAQDSESERLLLNKINSLEKEIQTLLSQLEEINYKLNRIEDTQQLRYVDLDKKNPRVRRYFVGSRRNRRNKYR